MALTEMFVRSRPSSRTILLLAGLVLVAINLRATIAGVGPVVSEIRSDTELPNFALGLLTTLPLLAFGLVSTWTSRVTRRTGVEGGVVLALVLIGGGTALRSAPAVVLLFGGTILLGVGIALGNVLLPALAKRYFPDRAGPVTSLYSSVMGIGATVAAGVSAPLAVALGWRGSLAIWVVPALVALALWVPLARRQREAGAPPGGATAGAAHRPPDGSTGRPIRVGRSRLAWGISLFMGFQSLTFYVMLAWMPDLLQSHGLSAAAAGGLLALSQGAGVVGTALVPLAAGRRVDQTRIVYQLGALEALSLLGLALSTGPAWLALWVAALGYVLGGTFGLALLLLVVRAPDDRTSTSLSGMAQSIGYLIAATGPSLFGLAHDLTRGWAVPLAFLALVLLGKVAVGIWAGRPGMVGEEART